MTKSSRGAPQERTVTLTVLSKPGQKWKIHVDPESCPVYADKNGVCKDTVVWDNQSDYDMDIDFPNKSPFKDHQYYPKKRKKKRPIAKGKVSFIVYKYWVRPSGSKPITPLDPIEPDEADINIMLDEGDTEE